MIESYKILHEVDIKIFNNVTSYDSGINNLKPETRNLKLET